MSDLLLVSPEPSVRTLRRLIVWAADRLQDAGVYFGHGTDNAQSEAEFLVLRSLGLPFTVSDEVLGQPLDPAQIQHVVAVINKRIVTRKPAAYLLGEAWFAGLRFYVNEHVLVPRSPLAELILERFAPWCREENIKRILDIGTGSGCLAVACALAFPGADVDAVDTSPEALAVAAKNVEYHGVQDRVALIRSDLFQELAGRRYDLIIANPPYVDADELSALPAEYRHEPVTGLYGGTDGLDSARRILQSAAAYLAENGVLVLEVGNSETALAQQYPQVPFLWLEFQHGGGGVVLLTREELHLYFPAGN